MAKTDDTKRSFDAAAKRIEAARHRIVNSAVPSGLRMIGEEIMTDVKASRPGRGVPKDKGVLAASGRVTGPLSGGDVELAFGGAAAPYALYQHEELHLNHPLGEARYLVRGLERWSANGQSVRRALMEMTQAALDSVAEKDRGTAEFKAALSHLQGLQASV